MFDNYQICPYTGLRSFTEDESLYFKGREQDMDQATSQLQKNKFLMLTGASGDGKSSLVYAGVIPNARSGFLKSKYSAWCIADFRPERAPFANLCEAVARQLDIPHAGTVQGELNHGFSALVDLYKNSRRFIDTGSEAWLQAGDKQKAAMKREAANLIILVDQFEEFFTNPENYQNGVPSRDANLVLNLLLETARIALEEDLPIYVIFTMRSDYIGQCAAFRGLPEYIGFSQFFVPRLNRTQLQQVIEEPAMLSGNRITRRLTERLIHDITEGVDQLPILQHALSQIWVAADRGREEMDLIHYAMVGGMSARELPDDQVARFESWFAGLSQEIRDCYHVPTLQNVLDTHTNKLYEQAAGYYTSRTGRPMEAAVAKKIIRTSFTCLTKIDQSRAVRNRMTLQEITQILGDPAYDARAVGALLNIFREPGNTFLHPFILEENPQSQELQPNQVLDITHESLIRNWQYLGRWAREEFDSYSVSLDFGKQLDRWVNSGKSSAFLLSIGPLTYFENWFNQARPNAWWIARYLPDEAGGEKKLSRAEKILSHALEFFQLSRRKHAITRMVMRFGPRRIALSAGLLALLVFAGLAISSYYKKQNGYVLDSIYKRVTALAADPRVAAGKRAALVAEELKLGRATVDEIAGTVAGPLQKIGLLTDLGSLLTFQGNSDPQPQILRTVVLADSLLELLPYPGQNPELLSKSLDQINKMRVVLELANYYSPGQAVAALRQKNAGRAAKWCLQVLQKQPAGFEDIKNLDLALENALNYHAFTAPELSGLLKLMSPFEGGLQGSWLQSNFEKNKLQLRGDVQLGYGFKYNGLYQELAYLYAAAGQPDKALLCIDSLLAGSQNNFQGDYAAGMDNASNIAAVFCLNGQAASLDGFVDGYCKRKKITAEEFYSRLLGRTIKSFGTIANLNLYWWMNQVQNLNLQFTSRSQLGFYFSKYRDVVKSTVKDPSQANLLLAVSYKNEGILKSLNREEPVSGEMSSTALFDQGLALYRMVDRSFLEQTIQISTDGGSDEPIVPRKYLFVSPDLKTVFHPLEPRVFFFFYFSDVYFDYILSRHLFDEFYPGQREINYLSNWLFDYNMKNIGFPTFMITQKIHYPLLKGMLSELQRRNTGESVDLNLLYLYLGLEARKAGEQQAALGYYDHIQTGSMFNLLRSKEFAGQARNQVMRLLSFAIDSYVGAGQWQKAQNLVRIFKNPVNQSSLYAYTAMVMLKEGRSKKAADQLIDSAKSTMARVENIQSGQPNRRVLAYAMTMQDPAHQVQPAMDVIKNLPEKFASIQAVCRSLAFYGDLFGAVSHIPESISGSDEADFLWLILIGYQEGKQPSDPSWKTFGEQYPVMPTKFMLYIDESN